METCSVVVIFESVDEILWCDHSNETSSAVLLHATICFSICYKMKFDILLKFGFLTLLEVKWINGLQEYKQVFLSYQHALEHST